MASVSPRIQEVMSNAARLATRGKGILASDESTGTVGKRLQTVGLENTVEMRRAYREVLYTPPGLGAFLSGIIMYEETLYQATAGGIPFVDVLAKEGILPGVKVDQGLVALAGTDGETTTGGIDGLGDRCAKYYKQGARFAKWRAVIKISSICPTPLAVSQTADLLARYAAICQQEGLVPIVEPEILIDGTHPSTRSADVAETVLAAVVFALHRHRVCLEGILLKPQMVLPGFDHPSHPSPRECAQLTLRTLQRTVPPAVPAIMFLSGGQSEEESTEHLHALNVLKNEIGGAAPWTLSFSFGRALQGSVLRIWGGKEENRARAQEMGLALARVNADASLGVYEGHPHPSTCRDDLREAFRGWR